MAPEYVAGLGRRRGRGGAVIGLTVLVLTWWLLIAAALAQTLPAPVMSAPKSGMGSAVRQDARIHLPRLPMFPIPVERGAFEEAQRGFRESDEDALDRAFSMGEWFDVMHNQAVRIIAIDGDAVEIELLEGEYAGRRGWLKVSQLSR